MLLFPEHTVFCAGTQAWLMLTQRVVPSWSIYPDAQMQKPLKTETSKGAKAWVAAWHFKTGCCRQQQGQGMGWGQQTAAAYNLFFVGLQKRGEQALMGCQHLQGHTAVVYCLWLSLPTTPRLSRTQCSPGWWEY